MSQPTPYARVNDFTTYARNNTAAPYNAAMLDAEFNAVSVSLNATLTNLGLIQRDDGQLKNTVVTPDSLNNATLNLIGDWTPKGPWLPSQTYAVRDMVTIDLVVSYVCAVAHLSSSFAIDLAAGYWQQVNGTDALVTNITFTQTDVVLGRVSSGGGPGEEIQCTPFARTLLDDANAAASLTTLGLGTGSNPTFNNLTVAGLVITGGIGSTFLYVDAGHGVTTAVPAPQNGQLLIGRTGLDPVVGSITGISGQVNVTNGAGTITLGLPQSIATTSTPTFATVNLTNLSVDSIPVVGASSALIQYSGFKWDHATSRLQLTDLFAGCIPYIDAIKELTTSLSLQWSAFLGSMGVNSTPTLGFTLTAEVTNTTNDIGQVRAYYAVGTLAATTTLLGAGYVSNLSTVNSGFTLPDLEHFQALQTTRGGASNITRIKGFAAHKEIVADAVAATTYGFWSDINTAGLGTNYQLYMGGTAQSLFGGNVAINGGLTVLGNTALGDAAGDALTVAPNAVTWSNNPTHSGNHTFSGTVNVTGKVDSASYVENGAGATQFSKTNGALAANSDLDCTTAASGLLLIRNNTDGGVAVVSVDIGTGTCTEISDPSAYVTVGADPGAGSSQFWITITGATIRLRNRYAVAKNVSVGYSLLGGTPA
jgi:hypothetical protein